MLLYLNGNFNGEIQFEILFHFIYTYKLVKEYMMVTKWIFKDFLKNNLLKYIIGTAALIISSLIQLFIPKLLGNVTDILKNHSSTINHIYLTAFLLLVLAVFLFFMKFTMRYFIMGRARDLECFLREKLFSHLQTLPPKFYNNNKTGDLMSYAINDLSAIRQAFSFGLTFLIDGIIINLASIYVMVRSINPILTLLAIWPIFISIFIIFTLRKLIRSRFTIVQNTFSNLSEKIQENISGIRVVKAFAQENYEIEKLNEASINRKKVQMDYVKISSILNPSVQLCFGLSFTITLVFGSSLVTKGSITLGDFIAFNTYLTMLMVPISNVGKIVEVWQKALASIKRLDEIFIIKTDIIDNNPSYKENKLEGTLEITNLSFSYPGSKKKVLKDININVASGKTLAIIGKTGSGKTALVNLLLRLFKIENNHIFIDGTDINEIPLVTLRDNIGYVPQDNFLFSTTIKENIQFFNSDISDEEIEDAAKLSRVYDNINDLPEGFNTVIGERGITLSGGQKQRISIARAIIKNPSILILDDSLSAVDTKTEEEILMNIKDILKGRTGIIIAHRISTIKHADEIVVLDHGKIIERGTHEELILLRGSYYSLYCSQTAENNLNRRRELVI